ncbi:MAG: FAD-binding protein [Phycisphaerales bacterium]|nr:FAD-binding protein [Phycisphaerales bacterium]
MSLKVVPASMPEPAIAARLREALRGDVRFDPLHRTLYATDASIYEIVPQGVVMPKDGEDVVRLVRLCAEAGLAITPRGAGTGLAGGAVGKGVVLDLSRHMNHIGRLDLEAKTVEVEPGVVLDQLNAALAPHGLHFAPDVATSSRATIGGMIANNSCGAHSVFYGRTVDHVLELDVVLGDGERVKFSRGKEVEASTSPDNRSGSGACGRIVKGLTAIRDAQHDEILRRFPKVMRSNGGYGLDRLGPPGSPVDATRILCGSEGTLGIVVGAKLALVPLPKHKALVVLGFGSVLDAVGATPRALEHRPAAVELVDRPLLDATRGHPAYESKRHFLGGDPEAILVVELFGESEAEVAQQVAALTAECGQMPEARATVEVMDPIKQQDVWAIRKAGLGLLMSIPGQAQSNSFVEDTAVDPSRLREYIARFMRILEEEDTPGGGYYAHASVGVIHVRPILDLKRGEHVDKMRRITERVCDLALEFGGTLTGEHGDGIVRSGFLERLYGPRIIEAFRQVKTLFDPRGLMNPGKIVDPWPMTENLRHGPAFHETPIKTYFDFSHHGGMAGATGMCSGVGECRKLDAGVMCPSYMVTREEKDSTRARANALRSALSNRGLIRDLDDARLGEAMDLCLSCKACKTECPTGVDMAQLKAEWLAQRVLRDGADRRARFIAETPRRLRRASRFARITNLLTQTGFFRGHVERAYGLDRRLPVPRLARHTFRQWWSRQPKPTTSRPRGWAVFFVDTWTNHVHPEAGIAAVKLLEAAGYDVLCPDVGCCGRSLISQGLLAEARQQAEMVLRQLRGFAARRVPIIGIEPSCVLSFIDEYPSLISARMARTVASVSTTLETFLGRLLAEEPDALRFRPAARDILYHGHCHQKALIGLESVGGLLKAAFNDRARVIPAGCCGMAGAFGHLKEHYDVSRAIAEDRLLPTVRANPEAVVTVAGFSCRQQIEHHARRPVQHVAEVLAEALM